MRHSVPKDRAEWKQLAITSSDLTDEVARLRVTLDPESTKPFNSVLAYKLYQQTFAPIEEFFSGKTLLSFVLSGALTSLPPHALMTRDPRDLASVDWLARGYAVTVLPSAASLKVLRDGKNAVVADKPMIGFGDPVFDRSAKGARPKVASLDRSLPAFYRGEIADTASLGKSVACVTRNRR
jgi:hypothetical protein